MNCNCVRQQLSAYSDGELSGADMIRIRTHLSSCRECSIELEVLRSMKAALGSIPIAEPSLDFESRLVSAVFSERTLEAKRVPWLRISLAAGTAAAVLMFALLQMGHSRDANMVRNKGTQPMRFDVQRDQAMMAGSDPLSGQAPIVTAGYGRR